MQGQLLCYVDIEHETVLADPLRRDEHLLRRMNEKLLFEELSGRPCLLLRYEFLAEGWLERLAPSTLLISGAQTDWSLYSHRALDALSDIIQSWEKPMIGFCAGHQVIAQVYGATLGPLRPLVEGELDPRPEYGPGLLKELGIQNISVVQSDPLFESLPNRVQMMEDHYWEVKTLPPELEWLAESELCRVQAFRHRDRPIYGVQFHPERYDQSHPHGRQLLQNFFALAGA